MRNPIINRVLSELLVLFFATCVTLVPFPVVLSRYHLSGKNWRGGWGLQTLWLDSEDRLVAAVNLGSDVETNIYAFREGYDAETSFFLKRAVDDAIDRVGFRP